MNIAQVLLAGIGGWYAEHLVIAALLVTHPEHTDRSAADQAAREGRLLHQYQCVEWIAVLPQAVVYKPVVSRVLGRGKQRPVQFDTAGFVVHFVLVAYSLGN